MSVSDWIRVFLAYEGLISLTAVIMAVYDKRRARAGKRRVPEARLLLTGALGGAAAMWVAMRLIHHKTRKPRFMWGLPAFFLLHLLLAAALWLTARGTA